MDVAIKRVKIYFVRIVVGGNKSSQNGCFVVRRVALFLGLRY